MGFCMRQEWCDIKIKKENKQAALEAVKAIERPLLGHFAWVDDKFLESTTLEDALEHWRWKAYVMDEDIVELTFEGEKLGDDAALFKALAPFVENGGSIAMSGEDGSHWKWTFFNKKVYDLSGEVVYETLPVSEEGQDGSQA